MYLDANNLYEWVMNEYLLTGGFKWLRKDEIDKSDISTIPKDYEKGCVLKVDLEDLRKLHYLHDDYPLAQEYIQLDEKMLLDYCKKILNQHDNLIGNIRLITPNIGHKQEHILQY